MYGGKINTKWLHWYTRNTGIISPDYVPESVYYSMIEPILNESEFGSAYSDKNFYDLLYHDGLFSETILRNLNGYFYNRKYQTVNISNDQYLIANLKGVVKLIVKPSIESVGGSNVQLFTFAGDSYANTEGQIITLTDLRKNYKENYLLQVVIKNNPFFSNLIKNL